MGQAAEPAPDAEIPRRGAAELDPPGSAAVEKAAAAFQPFELEIRAAGAFPSPAVRARYGWERARAANLGQAARGPGKRFEATGLSQGTSPLRRTPDDRPGPRPKPQAGANLAPLIRQNSDFHRRADSASRNWSSFPANSPRKAPSTKPWPPRCIADSGPDRALVPEPTQHVLALFPLTDN